MRRLWLVSLWLVIAASCKAAPESNGPPFERGAKSWDEVTARLESLAPQVSFMAAELKEKECLPISSFRPTAQLAVGSTFKLYVLGELGRQIEAGEARWDEKLAIKKEWKSLPSGAMQREPAGATFTLKQYAEAMISISDNTATDHLLFRLGRSNVEAVQTLLGHSQPSLNSPFLSTREAFVLKLGPESLVNEFKSLPPAKRRQFLSNVDSEAPLPSKTVVEDWKSPRFIDAIEWFASTEDLCRAMAELQSMGERETIEPLADVLALNPGVEFFRFAWAYAGFKGGEEPGVLNMTWLLQRVDHLWFVVSTTLNDPGDLIEEEEVLSLMTDAAGLVAIHGRAP